MKKLKVLIIVQLLFLLGACKNNDTTPIEPVADFDFEHAFKIFIANRPFSTFEAIELIDKSTDGEEYFWDFGNGETSTDKEPRISYASSGTYTISQSVISATGQKNTATRDIHITDRLLQNIEIESLNWNSLGDFPDWSADRTADVYIEYWRDDDLIFRSTTVPNVSPDSAPFTISVDQKVIMNLANVYEDNILISFRLIALDNGIGNIIFRSDGSNIGYGVTNWGYLQSEEGYVFQVRTTLEGTGLSFNSLYK
ncbi:PKD domain-containing protein [Roseivirga sp. E12]|uniref:PKD domain-containing protein n=1 Tax=Roseivirga sp. E12 TaxID=2819237 RepID=UPI001ABC5BF7|nr:PKD domain-containing protein [Roseivirga sp. E12]MBO3697373.1 hypothetical protein [Roseivirga sp. E12]